MRCDAYPARVCSPIGSMSKELAGFLLLDAFLTHSHLPLPMIRFPCKNCGKNLKAPLDVAGRNGKCSRCHTINKIPPAKYTAQENAGDKNDSREKPPRPVAKPDRIQVAKRQLVKCAKTTSSAANELYVFSKPHVVRSAKYTWREICTASKWLYQQYLDWGERKHQRAIELKHAAPQNAATPNAGFSPNGSRSSTQNAGNAAGMLLLGMMMLCCGCPLLIVGTGSAGSSGSSYSSPASYSSPSAYSSPSSSSSYSSPSPSIDDVHYEAYRNDMKSLGLDPDMQSEAEIRAANKILRDAGQW